jgi:hypothetical protein
MVNGQDRGNKLLRDDPGKNPAALSTAGFLKGNSEAGGQFCLSYGVKAA